MLELCKLQLQHKDDDDYDDDDDYNEIIIIMENFSQKIWKEGATWQA
jgi:hypothetical protein